MAGIGKVRAHMTIRIPLFVQKALDILEKNGFEAYIVGGCVRDFLLGTVPSDWDICTSALPEEMLSCFSGFRVIETGRRHGTITVLMEKHKLEITTFRVDGAYSDNRRPDFVAFSQSLLEDLRRRDFTVNAMAYHPKTGLIDAFGGQSDLADGRIRCVGDPNKRFEEDALRILRALRFSSALGFTIEKDTAAGVLAHKDLLRHIAKERITQEFSGILLGKNAAAVLLTYEAVIACIFPEILPVIGFSQKHSYKSEIWRHTIRAVSSAPKDLALRLALFFHDIAKPKCYFVNETGSGHFCGHAKKGAEMAAEIMRRMKYDTVTISAVSRLVAEHTAPLLPEEIEVKQFLRRVGIKTFRQLLMFRRADLMAIEKPTAAESLLNLSETEQTLQKIISEGQCYSINQLNVNGRDLIALGIKEGPLVGDLLERLLDLVIEGKIENKREVLIRNARQLNIQEPQV